MLHESKILTASFYRVSVVSEGLNLSIYILDATILCHVLLTKCYQVWVPPFLIVIPEQSARSAGNLRK